MDDFTQHVKVHEVLGEPAGPIRRTPPSMQHASTLKRLVHRAKSTTNNLLYATESTTADDAVDELLDQNILEPNRRAIARRTIALERWLADHGFSNGAPIRFMRSRRDFRDHDARRQVSVARPVHRDSLQAADPVLAPYVLDQLGWNNIVPTMSRVSVVPGFVLLELHPTDIHQHVLTQRGSEPLHGHVAVATVAAGPVIITDRDISGERLLHALTRELTHELASIGQYRHVSHVPTPAELAAHPERGWQLPHSYRSRAQVDRIVHEMVEERLRFLPDACHVAWPLTLSHLGFTPHDWQPLDRHDMLDPITRQVAIAYVGSLLLGKTLLETWNDHPEAYSGIHPTLAAATIDVTCSDAWHPHYRSAANYHNFVRAAQSDVLSPKFLDGLYRKTVRPEEDFSHGSATHHPVRLHVYHAPLHPSSDIAISR